MFVAVLSMKRSYKLTIGSRSRSNRPGRHISGPQSALTDFLASHNISARQIRADADARRQAAADGQDADVSPGNGYTLTTTATTTTTATVELTLPTTPATTGAPSTSATIPGSSGRATRSSRSNETKAQAEKRKKEQSKAIDKIKASKKFKRNKVDSDEEDDVALAIYQKRSAPLPGQMENCAICDKRFTVTPYSQPGPNGGLLCNPCAKELSKDDPSAKKKSKRPTGGAAGRRRKVQRTILDGTYHTGAKSLMALCIQTLTKNIDLAEELGDLPPKVIDKIARELSRRRLLDARTINLFLQPSAEDVIVYDGAKLSSDDITRIFQTVPKLKNLKIRNGIHFKDEVMEFLISRNIELQSLYLHGANLLTEPVMKRFLEEKGKHLQSLRIYYTDKHFGDDTLALLPQTCPKLERLKVRHNEKVTGAGIKQIAELKSLKHLGLQVQSRVHSDVFVHVINAIGAGLRTLSLTMFDELDNTVLDALHAKCRSLHKLRITDSEMMTDEGFVRLFNNWANPGLIFADFQKCRYVDAGNPRVNPDKIGLCSDGFLALMEHSGAALKHLNVHACRHISRDAFETAFAKDKVYENLVDMEVSFCEEVTDFVVGSIFRSCPNLRQLNVFGCMKVKDVRVPRGKILVGVPNAVGMVIEG